MDNYLITAIGFAGCIFGVYLFSYQKKVRRHIDQQTRLFKMVGEIHKKIIDKQ